MILDRRFNFVKFLKDVNDPNRVDPVYKYVINFEYDPNANEPQITFPEHKIWIQVKRPSICITCNHRIS